MCAVYACIGSDTMKVAGILRSAQNDSTVQDPIDQYKISVNLGVFSANICVMFLSSYRTLFQERLE